MISSNDKKGLIAIMMPKSLQSSLFTLLFGVLLLQAEPTKIMPLGDSITYGLVVNGEEILPDDEAGGYRYWLWHMLHDHGYDATFVGSEIAGEGLTPVFDPYHEGHRGWSSSQIANGTEGFLMQNPPDTILLHAGTNDFNAGVDGINMILDHIDNYEHQSGHPIKVYVALILDRRITDPIIRQFNENLKVLVGQRIRFGDDLTLVDMAGRAGLTGADYSDNTHPNNSGYQKMAQVWYSALMEPDTPGLFAYPYILVDAPYIHEGSLYVNYGDNSVTFEADIPDSGITIY